MDYEQISYAVTDRIATITLDRPDARNAFTVQMSDELHDAITRANADDDVRVIVFTARGKDFCVGADLSGGSLEGDESATDEGWVEPATRVARPMYTGDKPVIAAIRGAAVGVGSSMILPADFRLATDDARFGFVFARRGIYPEAASVWFLPRIVGLSRAVEWMVSGRLISADEALVAGLVHALYPADRVLDEAYLLARQLIETTAPVSVAVIRQALHWAAGLDSPEPVFELDAKLIASCADNPDSLEGVVSFLQRRPPEWTGLPSKDMPAFLPWRKAER